jgi:hypothetical protein
MKKLYGKLEQRAPDSYAGLVVVNGEVHYSGTKNLGFLFLRELKSQDRAKIEDAKFQLIEKLKQFDGSCLSLDVKSIMSQFCGLYDNAPWLVEKYGDVLPGSIWRQRLFKRDP